MDYDFSAEDQALRTRIRALIDEHMPDDFPGIFVDDPAMYEATARFCRVLAAEGLLTLSWPEEHGGPASSAWSQLVFREEMWSHNEPTGPQYMGVNWIGPAVMMFGTDEQKRFFLPRIARGEIVFCQGFSEPDAGSDLASLQLRATPTESGFVLNGQKIWTSYAGFADYCILATRTDSEGPKQQGLTVFLVPMDRPGIEVRPIDSITGPHHFHEVFFTDVEAQHSEVLGDIDDGWKVMTAGLSFERTGNPRYARSAHILSDLWDEFDGRWDEVPGSLQARYTSALIHTRVAQLLNYRVVAVYEDGGLPRLEASLARIASTTLDQEVADVAMDMEAPWALFGHDDEIGVGSGDTEHHWRYAQASTVAAGTLEIQKMLIARQTLNTRRERPTEAQS
jgi:alkylation response protein AidB-like acyl-CoA dehydrogenase